MSARTKILLALLAALWLIAGTLDFDDAEVNAQLLAEHLATGTR